MAKQRLKEDATAFAVVKKLTGIRGHRFCFLMPAIGAADSGFQDQSGVHSIHW